MHARDTFTGAYEISVKIFFTSYVSINETIEISIWDFCTYIGIFVDKLTRFFILDDSSLGIIPFVAEWGPKEII